MCLWGCLWKSLTFILGSEDWKKQMVSPMWVGIIQLEQKGREGWIFSFCLSWDIQLLTLRCQFPWFSGLQTQDGLYYQLSWVFSLQTEDPGTSCHPWSREPIPIINLLLYLSICLPIISILLVLFLWRTLIQLPVPSTTKYYLKTKQNRRRDSGIMNQILWISLHLKTYILCKKRSKYGSIMSNGELN